MQTLVRATLVQFLPRLTPLVMSLFFHKKQPLILLTFPFSPCASSLVPLTLFQTSHWPSRQYLSMAWCTSQPLGSCKNDMPMLGVVEWKCWVVV